MQLSYVYDSKAIKHLGGCKLTIDMEYDKTVQ